MFTTSERESTTFVHTLHWPLELNLNTIVMLPHPPRLGFFSFKGCMTFKRMNKSPMKAYHVLCVSEIVETGLFPT